MNIGVGSRDDADIGIDGTIGDLFLGSKSRKELLVKGKVAELERFRSAFAG
jgi:hypothetical protein